MTLRGAKGGIWTNSAVAMVLNNPNVIGTFKINGTEIDNYFPQIISHKDFQMAEQKRKLNTRSRGEVKHNFVRNLFKGIMTCSVCKQNIEAKCGHYKTIGGTINFYTDYLCRGVINHSGCTNKGKLRVSKFEKLFFDFILPALNIQPSKQSNLANNHLNELENDLAKTERKINQMVHVLETEDLTDMVELTTSLGKLKKQRDILKQSIQTERNKTLSKDTIPQEAKKLWELKERDTLGLTVTDIKDREYIRGVLPTLYSNVTLEFGDKTTAIFYRQDGETDKIIINQ